MPSSNAHPQLPSTSPWWRRRSLKLRLTASFSIVASVVMLGLIPIVYVLIERQLRLEMDRQMKIDWSLIEAHLESDGVDRVEWRKESPASPESPGYAETWFDVWAAQTSLLSHWPADGVPISEPPYRKRPKSDRPFYNLVLPEGIPVRVFQRNANIDGLRTTLRVFRDQSGLHETLRQIMIGLALGFPIAVLLAAAGGYLMAGRTLRPLTAMTEQAQLITSDSLSRRLPNPNPEDELGQLASVFNRTLENLEASFDSLKRFTADASHELRTPLTALRSVGEIALREAGDPEKQRETISSMLEESQRLNDLIDTMLMFARVESGRVAVDLKPISLSELTATVCDSVEVLATEKDQRMELEVRPNVRVSADEILLRHALMNILHNAIRYSPELSTIQVRCLEENGDAIIEVKDQGPGIAAEHQSKVFERFYRIDQARSRAEGGAGLGLAIAKLSVERIGGRIELESSPGEGCLFRFVFPPVA
ncbi:sensor histidine kinase [Haloferula chungangensis]|uniref:histidine kinase n=1 Tax=Haloferula chungangensis TaxID=1048331 RepID=A0ABW2LAD5_9BACT